MISTTRLFERFNQGKTSIQLFKYADKFRSVAAGTVVFREGEIGETMYVVKSGEVELYIGDKLIERVTPGQIFGEMALLDCPVRSASAVASVNSQLVPIDRSMFDRLINTSPYFAKEVLQIMAARLRRMDSELQTMHEREQRLRNALQ